jgi:hypothetical protein
VGVYPEHGYDRTVGVMWGMRGCADLNKFTYTSRDSVFKTDMVDNS